MAICYQCGKDAPSCLCDHCRFETDLEALCGALIAYRPGSGENPLWEELCGGLSNPYDLRNVVFALSDDLPSPRKEYQRVLAIAGGAANVPKVSRGWFYEIYDRIKSDPGLSAAEKNRLHGIALGACYMDYDYAGAEALAEVLREQADLPQQVYYNLAKFYTMTRRYDAAAEVIGEALSQHPEDGIALQMMRRLADENEQQRQRALSGKPQYMPNPKENRDQTRKRYVDFLASVGIDAQLPCPRKKPPTPIPRDQYPEPVEVRSADFDSFVAFDLETTGCNARIDSIIEIGAIRVTGGQIVERAEFAFQEFAKPYDRRLSEEVQQLTGIRPEDVKDAREMWEVFGDFMRFAGDDVLVGFNCMAFDSKFLVRAGRYANLVIRNQYFDVMRYGAQFQDRLGLTDSPISLETLSKRLDIAVPRAHRALDDAVTTAKVFLELKKLDSGTENIAVSDLLSDLDNW